MDNQATRIRTICYIGETSYKAGIFLSYKIAARKSYFKNLRLEGFESFTEALEEFKTRYDSVIDMETLRVNHLYDVRPSNVYSVFWTPLNVGICYTCAFADATDKLLKNDDNFCFWKHYLTYDEAQKYARERWVKWYKRYEYYIERKIPVNTVVNINEVKKGGYGNGKGLYS